MVLGCDLIFLRLHNVYRFIFLEATISHSKACQLSVDWYNNQSMVICLLESCFLLYQTYFQLLKSNTTESHLDFQMFNDITYQNKFIKSIQKPLQNLAACKTVFGTHNRHWFSREQHSLHLTHHLMMHTYSSVSVIHDTIVLTTCSPKHFNTLAHSKHFNVT